MVAALCGQAAASSGERADLRGSAGISFPPDRRRDRHAMKVMSFNIWSDAPRNSSWNRRRDRIADVLRRDDLDVAGLQEATTPMIRDLYERLPQYRWVGAGRDDGDQQGECTPIFFERIVSPSPATGISGSRRVAIGPGGDGMRCVAAWSRGHNWTSAEAGGASRTSIRTLIIWDAAHGCGARTSCWGRWKRLRVEIRRF